MLNSAERPNLTGYLSNDVVNDRALHDSRGSNSLNLAHAALTLVIVVGLQPPPAEP